jgi:hypothetical protein
MKHVTNSSLGIIALIIVATSTTIEARTWTSQDGKQLEGDLISADKTTAVIVRISDKKTFRVPLLQLSKKDQEYVEEFINSTSDSKSKDVKAPAKLTQLEIEALTLQRDELLAKASKEELRNKKGSLLGQAAILLLQTDEKQAEREIKEVIKEYGKEDFSNVGAKCLMALANHYASYASLGDDKAWNKAEQTYQRVWVEYPGIWADTGCEAANIVADHYLSLGDEKNALKFKEIVIEKVGYKGTAAGNACLWLADYYLKNKNEAKALAYLNQAVTTYKGNNEEIAAKAKVRIAALKAKHTDE